MCLYRSNLENVQNAISCIYIQVRHLVLGSLWLVSMQGAGKPESPVWCLCVTLFETKMTQRTWELVQSCPLHTCPSVGHRRQLAQGWLLVPLLSHHHDRLPERERVEVLNEKWTFTMPGGKVLWSEAEMDSCHVFILLSKPAGSCLPFKGGWRSMVHGSSSKSSRCVWQYKTHENDFL